MLYFGLRRILVNSYVEKSIHNGKYKLRTILIRVTNIFCTLFYKDIKLSTRVRVFFTENISVYIELGFTCGSEVVSGRFNQSLSF
jgi:predicted permease